MYWKAYRKCINKFTENVGSYFYNQLLSVELIDMHYFEFLFVGKNFEGLIVGAKK